MDLIPADLHATLRDAQLKKTTFLRKLADLPFVPHVGTTITVRGPDDPVPLIVEHLELVLDSEEVIVSTSIPSVERELPDGGTQPLEPAELFAQLLGAGFEAYDLMDDPPE